MTKTIAQLLGLPAVKAYQVNKLLNVPATGADPSLIYGVELEIEGLDGIFQDRCVSGISAHEDGSLRNSGYEYITAPMCHRELMYVLNQFFLKNKFRDANYSERCSTHVHANVQDLTPEQVKTILVVYMVFERLLFSWIQGDRYNNIFCVPLHETRATFDVVVNGDVNDWVGRWKNWEKYTAINLLPMFSLGTIEFRHMGGTCDLERINTWTTIIGKMFAWARTHSLDETINVLKVLNTTSQYQAILTQIFGEVAPALRNNTFIQDMEAGVLMLKYGCSNSKKKKEESPQLPQWPDLPQAAPAREAPRRARLGDFVAVAPAPMVFEDTWALDELDRARDRAAAVARPAAAADQERTLAQLQDRATRIREQQTQARNAALRPGNPFARTR